MHPDYWYMTSQGKEMTRQVCPVYGTPSAISRRIKSHGSNGIELAMFATFILVYRTNGSLFMSVTSGVGNYLIKNISLCFSS